MLKYLSILALSAFLFAGCAGVMSPVGAGLFGDLKAPLTVTQGPVGPKEGRAMCKTIIGIASGDCSIAAAMTNGGISDVSTVDYHAYSILGVYSTFETIVTGK